MSIHVLHADFETVSEADLIKGGLDNYVKHSTTDFWCMAFAWDDGEVQVLKRGEPLPLRIKQHIESGGKFVAHNVGFELAIWNEICVKKYGWPKLDPAQCICTMAMSFAMAMPGSLEKSGAAFGLDIQKDMAGSRVMMQLAQPKDEWFDGTPIFYNPKDTPEKFEILYEYCKTDIKVQQGIFKRALRLSPSETKIWELDYKINQRGIYCDVPAIKAAIEIVNAEKVRLDSEMRRVTNNQVATCGAVGQLKDFIRSEGFEVEGLAKADVLELLANPELPSVVRAALKLRQEAAKSSNAKLESMLRGAAKDNRIRGIFQYHGAGTGRWAGRRIQPQNFPRPKLEPEEVTEVLDGLTKGLTAADIDLLYGPPLSVISDCLRGFLRAAPGHDLIAADYSSVEARTLAWLAGEEAALEIFRGHGKIYHAAAANIYKISIDLIEKGSLQYQIGKTAVLALGYQGGVKAFQAMAEQYGINVTDAEAEVIKTEWRNANPNIVRYWKDLNDGAMHAVSNVGMPVKVGPKGREVTYLKKGSFLVCKLPSGRLIVYPYAKIETIEAPWGGSMRAITYMGEDSKTRRFSKQKFYGGLAAENITQGVSADLLREALVRLESRGYPVVMHIHDEAVCEILKGKGSLNVMEAIMAQVPAWATGLPIAAEGWRKERFQK